MFPMRSIGFILFILLLFAGLANAQAPSQTTSRANVFVGYSYFNTDLSSLGRSSSGVGWEASLDAKVYRWVSIVGDIDTHYGTQAFPLCQVFPNSGEVCSSVAADIIERNFLGGPRVSFPVRNFRPFAEVLAGYAHVNAGHFQGYDNSFAAALGGGVDYNVTRHFAWRFQADYLRTQFFAAKQDSVRISTGLVLRF